MLKEDRRMFFRSKMTFLYGEENLPDHLRFKFEKVKSISTPTARVLEIKELLCVLWRVTPEETELACVWIQKQGQFQNSDSLLLRKTGSDAGDGKVPRKYLIFPTGSSIFLLDK